MIKKYTAQISSPSEDFNTFLYNYFTGPVMIRARQEEDTEVWHRLNGQELEIAKQMVIANLSSERSEYIRAVSIFRDERALPFLYEQIKSLSQDFCYERTLAAKTLYDWVGYDNYFNILDDSLLSGGQFIKTSLSEWIDGIGKAEAIDYIYRMLNDSDSFVRWCAYGSLKRYLNLCEQEYEETIYYTSDEVYEDKELFDERLKELRMKVAQEGIDFI